jgi:hypothetical protein
MSNNQQVLNINTNQCMRLKQARRKVQEGSMLWVVENESVRTVTLIDLPEVKETRELYEKQKEPLPAVNPRSVTRGILIWEPPAAERSMTFKADRQLLIARARQFASQAIAQL